MLTILHFWEKYPLGFELHTFPAAGWMIKNKKTQRNAQINNHRLIIFILSNTFLQTSSLSVHFSHSFTL